MPEKQRRFVGPNTIVEYREFEARGKTVEEAKLEEVKKEEICITNRSYEEVMQVLPGIKVYRSGTPLVESFSNKEEGAVVRVRIMNRLRIFKICSIRPAFIRAVT